MEEARTPLEGVSLADAVHHHDDPSSSMLTDVDCNRIGTIVQEKLGTMLQEVIHFCLEKEVSLLSRHLRSTFAEDLRNLFDSLDIGPRQRSPDSPGVECQSPFSSEIVSPQARSQNQTTMAASRLQSMTCQELPHLRKKERAHTRRRKGSLCDCDEKVNLPDVTTLEMQLANDMFAEKFQRYHSIAASSQQAQPIRPFSIVPERFSDAHRCKPEEVINEGDGPEIPSFFDIASSQVADVEVTKLESSSSLVIESPDRVLHHSMSFYGGLSDLKTDPVTNSKIVVWLMCCSLGFLPWSPRFRWGSKAYQLIVSCGSACVVIIVVMKLFRCYQTRAGVLEVCIDLVLAVGTFLGFLASLLCNASIVKCEALLVAYSQRSGIQQAWDRKAVVDTGCALLLWSVCLASRLVGESYSTRHEYFAFAFGTFLILGLCTCLLRWCRCLCSVVHAYCRAMMKGPSTQDAMKEWYMLHSFCRTVCSSLQLCFLILMLTTVFCLIGVIASAASTFGRGFDILGSVVPAATCFGALFHLSLRASSLTDTCAKVPSIISAISVDEVNLEQIFLVTGIMHTQAGFCIYDMRLDSSTVFKACYITCAITFAWLAKVPPELYEDL